MKLNKIIFTSSEIVKNKLKTSFNLQNKKIDDFFEIYEGSRELYKDEENIILAYFKDFKKALNFVEENYDIFKIAFVGFAKILGNTELIHGDVIIPNTFISLENIETIFLDYAVGEDYDLNNFGLILNGICLTTNKDEIESTEFLADIKDDEIHNILIKFLKRDDYLEKIVVIKGIIDEGGIEKTSENIVIVLDLVI